MKEVKTNKHLDYFGCHMPLDDFEAEYWDANDYCNYGEKKEEKSNGWEQQEKEER